MRTSAFRSTAPRLAALAAAPALGVLPFARPAHAQAAHAPPARPATPVLAFPEAGLDDSAAYQGYQTRLFRDAAGNTVQVYLDARVGRVVHVLADAENESVGLTLRTPDGAPAPLRWDGADAAVTSGPGSRARTITYRLVAEAPVVRAGLFLLGSMRVEREFQDRKAHLAPFGGPSGGAPYRIAEYDSLFAALGRLPGAERRRHLALLGAPDVAALEARVQPTLSVTSDAGAVVARAVRGSLDGRDTLAVTLRAALRDVEVTRVGRTFELRARRGTRVPFTVAVTTTGRTLRPLARGEIFTSEKVQKLPRSKRAPPAPRARSAL